MCAINYTYAGPALLVLPLFLISLVNLFVAGPPLKTIVLDSSGSTYGASLPFMRLEVAGATAKFSLSPRDEMTHFFVVTCYAAASAAAPLALDAVVTGMKAAPTDPQGTYSLSQPLAHVASPATAPALSPAAASQQKHSAMQLLQPLLGHTQYEVVIKSVSPTTGAAPPNLPAIEYRLTYVPTKFTYTQICVRAFFLLTSTSMLIAYAAAIFTRSKRELGQMWVSALLVLLIALNDPLYIARVVIGGNHALYVGSGACRPLLREPRYCASHAAAPATLLREPRRCAPSLPRLLSRGWPASCARLLSCSPLPPAPAQSSGKSSSAAASSSSGSCTLTG